jgi:dolichol-phosphate mannosyltransferase
MPEISIVVPVRNEAGNIAPLVEEIARALAGRDFEIVYVNDGSSDGTEAELQALAAKHPFLRQVKHARSCGQSAAITTGVGAARAPLVATLDGDGQNDPAFLPALIDPLSRAEVGLVAGQRVGRKATAFKKFQSRIANAVRGGILRRENYEIAYVDVIDRDRRHGVSNYGMWDRLWVGILDLMGVWWLTRRRKNVPQVSEVSKDAR